MTEQPIDYTTPEARAAAIAQLLAAVETSSDHSALSRIARRAGFLWRCASCREDNYPGRTTCRCGAPQPDRL
ncbi:hypothetical protein [Streptomyces sp. W1SF4]|uniref:hypothetical protein n=1 Tax=Streptomyces sp. W1SF4 TaxID=2305220 RepID=UPI000F6CE4B7|nr:hypothetical protein [Streptomyces sp. W1SF4]AZM91457.1 hypothetical protein D1J60_25725 [Streptomyces sp. W1SF4]